MNIKLEQSKINKDFKFTEVDLKGELKAHIYDDCLPLDTFKTMKRAMLNPFFAWYYNNEIVAEEDKLPSPVDGYDNTNDICQFTHMFFNHGNYQWSNSTSIIAPILNLIAPRAWIRVKANLSPREKEHTVGGWHYDIPYNSSKIYTATNKSSKPYINSITAQLHLNTNNGYTILETGRKLKSIENRLVIFPNHVLHTGVRQTDTKIRLVINFNFFATI